jgi:hypothetical protein
MEQNGMEEKQRKMECNNRRILEIELNKGEVGSGISRFLNEMFRRFRL